MGRTTNRRAGLKPTEPLKKTLLKKVQKQKNTHKGQTIKTGVKKVALCGTAIKSLYYINFVLISSFGIR